jgi:hypothetical protein
MRPRLAGAEKTLRFEGGCELIRRKLQTINGRYQSNVAWRTDVLLTPWNIYQGGTP